MVRAGRLSSTLAAAICCLALGLAGERPAGADDSSRQRAEALLRAGNEQHDRGELDRALESYLAAQRLYPSYKIDFNVGVTLQAMKRPIEALARFDSYLAHADARVDATRIDAARRKLAGLRQEVGSVRINCMTLGASVELDGRSAGKVPLPRELYVLPGRHQITVSRAGYRRHAESVDLQAGDHRTLTISLIAEPRSAALPAPAATPAATPETRPKRRLYTWVLAGSAAAVLAVAVAFGTLADREYEEYESTPSREVFEARRDSVPRKALWANVCFGVAGALGAAAVTLFILEPRLRRERVSSPAPRLDAVVGRGLWLRGRF